MEHREDIPEEKSPELPQTSTSLTPITKDNLATRTQNYITQIKRSEKILIQFAFSIGLGSLWRFPYLCHLNGGGNFILTYLFMLLLLGIPLLYMEMILGEWLCLDNVRIWKFLVPWLGGIGYTSMLVCVLVSLYTSIIVSWSFTYLGHSFHYPLPWGQCPLVDINITGLSCLQTVFPQYFWYHTALSASASIEEGAKSLVPNLTLGIFITWFLLFIIMNTGQKFLVLILFISVSLLYLILLCFLIRGFFLEGAITSLKRMVTAEFSAWASLDLWCQAAGHVLYSLGLGLGLGTMINISYKPGGIQVAFLVALVHLVTSLLTTSIIFMVLGFWATTSGQACIKMNVHKLLNLIDKGVLPQDISPPENILLLTPLDYLNWIDNLPLHLKYQVIHYVPSCSIKALKEEFMQGPGLTFVAFSQVILLLPGASLWAILFFLALLIVEMNTLINILEGVVFSLQSFISTSRSNYMLLSVIIFLGGFLGSLIFTSHSGSYVMSLIDEDLIPLILIIIVAFQNVALAWVYGANRFREELYSARGHVLWSIFIFLWCYVTLPGLLVLFIIHLMHLIQRVPHSYIAWNSSMGQEVKELYQRSTLGWVTFLSILTFLPIPIYPLCQRWYLQDRVKSNRFKNRRSKNNPLVPTNSLARSKKHLAKSQERTSNSSLKSTLARNPKLGSFWHINTPWGLHTPTFSGFTVIGSLVSAISTRSASLATTSQESPVSETAHDDKDRETEKKNLYEESLQ